MTDVFHPFNNPKIISICTGMGGLEHGIKSIIPNAKTIAYVEREAFIIQNLLALMEQGLLDSAPLWADVTTFDGQPFHNRVHGIVGGYPCQGESVAGNMAGTKDPRFIWWSIESIIRSVNPIWCFFENVSNHLNVSYPIVQASLRSLGYRVEETICSAEEVGAPHGRKRIFILAIKLEHTQSGGRRGLQNPTGTRQGHGATWASRIPRTTELGNTQHNGQPTEPQFRGYETPSNNGRTQEPQPPQQPTRTDRPTNEPSLPRSQEGSEQLANANESGLWRNDFEEFQPQAQRGSNQLANANSERHGRRTTNQNGVEKRAVCSCEGIGASVRCKTEGCRKSSSEMANASNEGLQRGELDRTHSEGNAPSEPCRPTTECNTFSQWPARPGQPQHHWEAPRAVGNITRLPTTLRSMWSNSRAVFAKMLGEEIWEETDHYIKAAVEPGMGCTINGYNFREDLLRMYGNAVVQQQAAKALTLLLDKHGIPSLRGQIRNDSEGFNEAISSLNS
ncbi:DNA cytosine methyltransferase [Roseivirga seohaensis]|uniref:DNA cytosine methyltransferase n=1 Tax=Roseivirga seohaensis TaxID=1914963 RepID=UPI003BABB9E9